MEKFEIDPSSSILKRKNSQLDSFFLPKNIAVVGASEREFSVGRTIFWNLLRSPFGGTVFPVNPKRRSVLGVVAYPSVQAINASVDMVIIVTPAKNVLDVILDCAKANVSSVIVISAGFKEMGLSGIQLEKELLQNAKINNMRIIGPNCLGIMNPITGMNATFAADVAPKGNIAFLSQSGALCTAVLDWSIKEKVGFSGFVSIGSMVDVNWGDLIDYFGDDPNTKSILIYMENVGDARSFLSAAKKVAITKPIILIKAGVTEESAKAAASHTGALAGSNDVFNAALNRVGVLRVDTISELFNMADILSKQPLPNGPKLTILTNAGGPGVIATDALIKNGGKLSVLSNTTIDELNKILPEAWSRGNPVDLLGDASPDLYKMATKIASKDGDGLLVILTPQYMTDPTKTAEKLAELVDENCEKNEKPIFASWMGGFSVEKGKSILNEKNIPIFSYPDEACKTFGYMWSYENNLRALYETPNIVTDGENFSKKEIFAIFEKLKEERRLLLTESESKKVLQLYNIPTVQTFIATTSEEAIIFANKIGFPVVLKLHSTTITHKTDVGGVKLNLKNDLDVKRAYEDIFSSVKARVGEDNFQGVTVQKMVKLKDSYEIILGSSIDNDFGPVLLFGSGGELVEIYKDKALALPPLTTTLAKRLMEKTKIYEALKGIRGKDGINLGLLEEILVKFSYLIVENPQIAEFDINPLVVSPSGIIALDARIVLHDFSKWDSLPTPAIRPYPLNYVSCIKLKNGETITIRPSRPEDEVLLVDFLKSLSEKTIFERYLSIPENIATHERLLQICFNDYDREITLVAENTNKDNKKQIVAISKLSKFYEEGFFAFLIRDDWQNKGLGSSFLNFLVHIAKSEKLNKISAKMRKENLLMKRICEKNNFIISKDENPDLILAELKIKK